MGIKVQKEIRKRSREIILSSNPGRTDTQEALTPVKKHIQPFYTIAGEYARECVHVTMRKTTIL